MTEWELVARKRDWVPEWLWQLACIGNLAVYQPFRGMLTTPYGSRPYLVWSKE